MKKLLKLRQLKAQLPMSPSGDSLITARAVEELTGFPAGTVYSAASRGLIHHRMRLASTCLFAVEDLLTTFCNLKARSGRGIEI